MMSMKNMIALVLSSTALAGALQAAEPAPVPRPVPHVVPFKVPTKAAAKAPILPKMTAEQIVERNVAARGGLAAWERVNTMTMSGKLDAGHERKDGGAIATITAMSQLQRKAYEHKIAAGEAAPEPNKVIQLPYTLSLERPNKMRLEIPFQGQTAVQVYDGKQGWKLRPFLGRHEVESYTAQELKNAAGEQELDGPLVNSAAKGTKVALDGTDLVDGQAAYRLKMTLKNGDVRRVWIDAKTFLESRIEGPPRHFDGKMRPVVTDMHDYKPVQGLMVARELVTSIEGTRQSERIQVEQVAINPPLGGSAFSKPM